MFIKLWDTAGRNTMGSVQYLWNLMSDDGETALIGSRSYDTIAERNHYAILMALAIQLRPEIVDGFIRE